ncbi:MAG: hypothetical protein ACRYFW_14875 [Janthinobacterium lividum]
MVPVHDQKTLPDASGMDERKARRRAASIAARLYGAVTAPCPVRVLDLTHLGCRVSASQLLSVGAFVTLELPHFTDVNGWVAWSLDGEIGLDFAHPLPPRVVDYILDRAAPSSQHSA